MSIFIRLLKVLYCCFSSFEGFVCRRLGFIGVGKLKFFLIVARDERRSLRSSLVRPGRTGAGTRAGQRGSKGTVLSDVLGVAAVSEVKEPRYIVSSLTVGSAAVCRSLSLSRARPCVQLYAAAFMHAGRK